MQPHRYPQQPYQPVRPPAPRRTSAAVIVLAVIGGVLALLLVIGGAVALLTSGQDQEPTGTPASAAAGVGSKVTAQQVVDAIAKKWPAPNPDDNTSGCKAKDGDTAPGCVARVTTDAVTVTEFADDATAKRWANELAKTGSDYRQVGWFVLSWAARDQDLTSDEARDSMVAIAKAAIS